MWKRWALEPVLRSYESLLASCCLHVVAAAAAAAA